MQRADQTRSSEAELSANAEPDVKPMAKMVSACVGSFITTLTVTPFDVVKTRLQSESMSAYTSVEENVFRSSIETSVGQGSHKARPLTGPVSGLFQIARNEGIRSLWRGLIPSLTMLLPANIVQFMMYERLLLLYTDWEFPASAAAAGASARTVSASIVSPIELFRTRVQAAGGHYPPGHTGDIAKEVFRGLQKMIYEKGYLSLWNGVGVTLWRDVPFSAFYWWAYERTRRFFLQHPSFEPSLEDNSTKDIYVNFMSGGISGIMATLLTQPFDVSKTARQVHGHTLTRGQILLTLYSKGGARALWKGTLPRCVKVAPSCAIMISTYHATKKYFSESP
ncbi:manganese ion transporter [Schizosaccharomyces cryophilus OY26]|uniref:Manganese ion transporter n=1 Tax=Schizosaccharomyces cryophilus (strain OY26 / ATCC MYA-4695 / CBS 11777 / NBRC 106824 / NRRL Y48691) TaxID=653667 RepID=S9W8F7_SCHCR|nr:manganese ion transporter [Schizosaccharomyces cryophilus OY26]EPY54130.1 manganese ion transporter [Schizosaccharomyces cryophilus OY26]